MKHLTNHKWLLVIAAVATLMTSCDDKKSWVEVNPPIPVVKSNEITFDESTAHDMTVIYNNNTEVYTMALTGTDPYICTKGLIGTLPEEDCVLEFEYQLDKPLWAWSLYFAPPYEKEVQFEGLESNVEWTPITVNISRYREEFGWGGKGKLLRFDWGTEKDRTLRIRGLKIREMTDEEKLEYDAEVAKMAAHQRLADNFLKYLEGNYPSSITNVEVTTDKVIISGNASGSGTFHLADITPYDNPTEETTFPSNRLTAINSGSFTVTVNRKVEYDGYEYDRLLSRWAVIKTENGRDTLDSHARYADVVAPIKTPDYIEPTNKKGVLGLGTTTFPDGVKDIDYLGCGVGCFGLLINEMLVSSSYSGQGGIEKFQYAGHDYYMSVAQKNEVSRIINEYSSRDMQCNTYIQCYPKDYSRDTSMDPIVRHPDCIGGYQCAFNMTNADGVNAYAAWMTFIGENWGDKIMNYFIHNEVNAPEEWCNMGYNQPEAYFMDYYLKSVHLVYNIIRQYNQHISTGITLTHWWNRIEGNGYPGRLMVDQMKLASKAEGDWNWGLSLHPYPSNLNEPSYWTRDGSKATYNLAKTPMITMNNLDVIQAWADQEENKYQGKYRVIYLTEQGTNSVSYSSADQRSQAAGAVWFWRKLNHFDCIKGALWHAHIDNRKEFGLRIGLRRYADDEDQPSGRKQVWTVWRMAGTNREDQVFNTYMNDLGISSWDEIFRDVTIE